MPNQRIAPWRWVAALFGLCLGLGAALAIFVSMLHGAQPGSLIMMGLVLAALIGIGGWLTWMYWSRIDEAAREAHKWAWFWGGNAVILPLMIGFLFLNERPDMGVPLWPGFDEGPAGYVATGGMIALFVLILGYSVAWLFWWLWKSR